MADAERRWPKFMAAVDEIGQGKGCGFKKFFDDWKAGAAGNRSTNRARGQRGDVGAMAARFDSWPSLMRVMRAQRQRPDCSTGVLVSPAALVNGGSPGS